MAIGGGTTIGPYKVDREIGRGGMGVVFLAQDTRLGRTVALKALPDDVATDPDRLQRFEREARVLASLNHPNVAAIYGLEEREGHRYLALEYIEGETLADRIARGPLPLAETLDVCIQIAAGMEAAHDGGVVHRDLKPGNVMITPADQVKILDFGLAKGRVATDESGLAKSPALVDSPTSSPTLAHSPTVISPATLPGVILGTAAYLSPEQARGKIVDRRTDIWSFGCILYECLTGKRAFDGETVSDTIAKILEREMEWSALPAQTPPRLRELLERCLTKDPKRRLRDIGDARLALEEIRSGRYVGGDASAAGVRGAAGAGDAAANRPALLIAAASAIAGAVIAIAAWNAFGPGAHAPGGAPAHLSVTIPADIRFNSAAPALGGRAIILQGSTISAPGADPVSRLYVRRMDRNTFEPLRGTERVQGFCVSPDGKWILFGALTSEQVTQVRAFKVPVDGGSPPAPLGDIPTSADTRVAWLESGEVINSVEDGTKYVRFPSRAGPPPEPRKFDAPGFDGRLYTESSVLPGDRGVFLSAIWYEQGVYRQGIGVLDLKSGKAKIVIRDGGCPRYFPTGHLLFTRQDALFAVPFDVGSLEVKGEPVAILDGLFQSRNWINARFDIAADGTLLYPPGGNVSRNRRLIMVDRAGKVSEWSGERQAFEYYITASADGARVTTSITNANAITEIWISERGQQASHRLATPPGVDCLGAAWAPDRSHVAVYESSQSAGDGIYILSADGAAPPRRLTTRIAGAIQPPTSFSPDGSTLLTTLLKGNLPRLQAIKIPADPGVLAEPKPVFHDEIPRGFAFFSPNGRAIAYLSLETGKPEVYVSAWDGTAAVGRVVPISVGGGFVPHWSADGKKLYYQTMQEKVMVVEITEKPEIRASAPVEAWDLGALRVSRANFGSLMDILPDGRLLAVQRGEGEGTPTRLDVVVNFPEELKARLAAAKK